MMDVLIGALGAVIAAAIGAWAVLRARRPRRADVEAVDAIPLEIARQHERDAMQEFVRGHDEDARRLMTELQRARDQAARERATSQPPQPAPRAPARRAVSPSGEGPRVEPIDVSVPDRPARWMDPPVVDLKLRNRGGESAVLKRMVVEVLWARRITAFSDLLPYADISGGVWLPPSATYDVELPGARGRRRHPNHRWPLPGNRCRRGRPLPCPSEYRDPARRRLSPRSPRRNLAVYAAPARAL